MDNNYKVNRFNMPLMQVIGVSAVAKNFNVAFGPAAREDTLTRGSYSNYATLKKMPKFALLFTSEGYLTLQELLHRLH
ncbi:hypothetical protein E4U44_007528 [Claviceps purpurea]|nr:hypothetical protein E4U44_007528 [Claviceps purpurea]